MDIFHNKRNKKYCSIIITIIYMFYQLLKIVMIVLVPWSGINDFLINMSVFYLLVCIVLVAFGLDTHVWFIIAIPVYLVTVIGLVISVYLIMSGRKKWFVFPMIVYCLDSIVRIYFLITGGTEFKYDNFGFIFSLVGVLISILYWHSNKANKI